MKKRTKEICAAVMTAAIMTSVAPTAHATDWGGIIGGVLGGMLGGGSGSSGGSSGGGNIFAGASNQKHARKNPTDNERYFIMGVKQNDIGVVRAALEAGGVDINGVYPSDMILLSSVGHEGTALHIALAHNNFEMMQLLLENGADVNGYYTYDNDEYVSYLVYAVRDRMDISCLQYLLDWGADINGRWKYLRSGNTENALNAVAAEGGYSYEDTAVNVAEFLIERGIDTENRDNMGYTPFLRAVRDRRYKLMDALAAGGCNIHAKDKGGHDALKIALDSGNLDLYKAVQAIYARGQQPSQYKPTERSTQHTARQGGEQGGAQAADEDDPVVFQ